MTLTAAPLGRQAGEPGRHLRPPPDTPHHGLVGDGALGAIITSIIGRLCAGSRCWGTEALPLPPLPRSAVHADEELHIDASLDVGLLVNWRPVHSSLQSLTPPRGPPSHGKTRSGLVEAVAELIVSPCHSAEKTHYSGQLESR